MRADRPHGRVQASRQRHTSRARWRVLVAVVFELSAQPFDVRDIERADDVHDGELSLLTREHDEAGDLVLIEPDIHVDIFPRLLVAHGSELAPARARKL